jgi:hypothetical protein
MKNEAKVYYVRWVETREAQVMATSEEEAIEIALKNAGTANRDDITEPIAIAA